MGDNRLSIGTHFRQGEREYVIKGTLPSGELQVRDLVTNVFSARTEEAILNELFYGDLEIIGEEGNLPFLKEKLKGSRASDLTVLNEETDEKRKREAYRRERYVRGVLDSDVTAFTQQSLAPVIEDVSQKIREPRPPSWRSV